MWNDLNMRDRHKFIKLAVTNGVYDLDTIRSLYDSNEYGKGGPLDKRKKGNERQREEFEQMSVAKNTMLPENEDNEEVVNADDTHEWKRTHWGEYDKAPTGNKNYGDVYIINRPEEYDTPSKKRELKQRIREDFPNAVIHENRPYLFKKYLFGENRGKYKPLNITGFRVPYATEENNVELPEIEYTTPEITKVRPAYREPLQLIELPEVESREQPLITKIGNYLVPYENHIIKDKIKLIQELDNLYDKYDEYNDNHLIYDANSSNRIKQHYLNKYQEFLNPEHEDYEYYDAKLQRIFNLMDGSETPGEALGSLKNLLLENWIYPFYKNELPSYYEETDLSNIPKEGFIKIDDYGSDFFNERVNRTGTNVVYYRNTENGIPVSTEHIYNNGDTHYIEYDKDIGNWVELDHNSYPVRMIPNNAVHYYKPKTKIIQNDSKRKAIEARNKEIESINRMIEAQNAYYGYDKGGNLRIAPYRNNSSYADRKLYRNVKKDFRKNPELEYKDYKDYGVRIYNPSISSDAPNRKERQDIMLDRIKQDFPDIQKNDVKKTAFKSNSLGWHNNTTGYMGVEDKRTLFGLQQNYDFVNNIVPYVKLGMETPESIQRREELERRNRNTTFDYTNNFDIGGDLPTDPDKPIIDTQPIINKIRANNLAKYAMRDSALQQIQDLTNRMHEEEIKRRTMEWLNPSNYTDKRDMVNALRVPVAEARPTLIKTYKDGGEKNRWNGYTNNSNTETKEAGNYTPEDWLRINYPDKYKQIQESHTVSAKPEQNRFTPYIVKTPKYNEDIENAAYDFGYTPYGVFLPEVEVNANASEFRPEGGYSQYYQNYKNALDDLKLRQDIARTSEKGIELTPLYQDPIFNTLFLGAGLFNGIGNAALGSVTKATMEGLSKPITTVASQIPQLGKYSYMLPTLDKALWATTGASGLYNRVSDEGIQGITNHPFLTAMDLGMLSPVAKGIKTVGNEAMWKYTPELKAGIEMSRNVRNAKLNPNIELPAVTRFKLGDVEINNPEMFYRQGDGNLAQDLLNSGIIRTKDTGDRVVVSGINLSKPTQSDAMFNKGKVAFNPESNMGKYLVTTMDGDKMVYAQPKTWTGNNVYVNNWRENPITLQESSGYVFDPNYGYVKLPTTEMPSFTTWEDMLSLRPQGIHPQKMKLSISPKEQLWTPEQWTAAQDAAIARGDIAEAQRLRDLHTTITNTATPGKYYRGTLIKSNSYLDRHIDEDVGEMNGIYLTKNPKYAKTYGDVEEFYLHSNNPLETEGSWTGIIDDAKRLKIENAGYDAVVNNRFDTGFLNKLLRNSRDETITFNGKNIKLTDAVTYDNNGVRIPLGLRDNFKLNDIRYGLIGLGATGLGLGLGYPFLKNYEQ